MILVRFIAIANLQSFQTIEERKLNRIVKFRIEQKKKLAVKNQLMEIRIQMNFWSDFDESGIVERIWVHCQFLDFFFFLIPSPPAIRLIKIILK